MLQLIPSSPHTPFVLKILLAFGAGLAIAAVFGVGDMFARPFGLSAT